MNFSVILSRNDFLFIPPVWERTFTDTVIETYISISETQIMYGRYLEGELPGSLDFIEEDEISELCDRITSDIEYGVDLEELSFNTEEEVHDFYELCHDNMAQMLYDINRVLEHYKMPYALGRNYNNMPVKEVW